MMTLRHEGMSRRQALVAAGTLLTSALWRTRPALALEAIRQGYQTNIWGMPTYYLLKSGALEKRGIKVEEFAVPSGNLTMQQMVARQVDLGTYAAPSFILGHDKGGLIGIAVIEHVGRTTRIMARKDLGLTKVEQLKGLKIANQTGSSVGNIFVDQIAPAAGLKKGDYQEVRMDVNNMVAAMAATPEFVTKSGDAIVEYLRAWMDVARDFKEHPSKVADAIYDFYASKGYSMSRDTFRAALATIDVDPSFPSDLPPYMQHHAEVLLREKKIAAIPDWDKALRPEFMERARSAP